MKLIRESGLLSRHVSIEAARLFFAIEKPHSLVGKMIQKCPETLLNVLSHMIPTLVFVLTRKP
jgi:hypothetical protein